MQLSRRRLLGAIASYCLLSVLPVKAASRSPLVNWFGEPPASGQIRRVLSAGPVADMLLWALAEDRLIGFSMLNLQKAPAFIGDSRARGLPVSGRLTGRGNTLSVERVIALNPDLIIDSGTVDDTYRSLARRVASQTQIPYLLVDGKLKDAPDQLLATGEVLGVSALARQQAALARHFLDQARAFAARQSTPVSFYSARGVRGLETGLQGSLHTEAIELLGLRNVAHAAGRTGLTSVSMEQLLLWQPDIIITQSVASYQAIMRDPLWRGVHAVAKGHVLLFSGMPFGWLDSPPGINRLLGLRRLHAHFDASVRASLAADGRAFFRLFMHSAIDDSQWRQLVTETVL